MVTHFFSNKNKMWTVFKKITSEHSCVTIETLLRIKITHLAYIYSENISLVGDWLIKKSRDLPDIFTVYMQDELF